MAATKMRRLAFMIVAAALLLGATPSTEKVGNAAVQNSTNTPSKAKVSSSPEQGSPDKLVFVEVIGRPESAEEAQKAADERTAKNAQDAHLVSLTADLATYTKDLFYATLGLGGITLILAMVALKQAIDARKAVDAAVKSANVAERALTELERPFVYAQMTDIDNALPTGGWSPATGGMEGRIEIAFHNYGRTPANLTRIHVTVKTEPPSADPPYINSATVGGDELPIGCVSAPGVPYIDSRHVPLSILNDADEISRNRLFVWVVGFVRYSDVFGTNYITGFKYRFDVVGMRFVALGDKRHNYARAETKEDIPPPTQKTNAPQIS